MLIQELDIPGMKLESLNVSLRSASIGARMGAARKAKDQRFWVKALLKSKFGKPFKFRTMVIVIARIGPRALDSDNLAGSAKHVRDGIADWLGVNDGDNRITWLYEQSKDGKKYGVKMYFHCCE